MLNWRSVGPFRGGRSVAAAGDPGNPLVFYFGAAGGGVWKTVNAGSTWRCVSDGFLRTAAVGALAVAPADPNVLYVGTGEACIRGNVAHGDGVYRSEDAGRTWRHLGLQATRHIGKVRVHPQNPDLVYVAALGHAFGPNRERGVFRSHDGGATWDHVLFRDEDAGCVDLAMDPQNPRILYAAMYQVRRGPHFLSSGGPGSGLWKSSDGGDSWSELTITSSLKGRIGVTARGDRLWAAVESEDGGIYRSDDAGATWLRTNATADQRSRPFYFMHIFAHPTDPQTVHTMSGAAWRSVDGGTTFEPLPVPHGDNHDLWIDPKHPDRMIAANDGGATISCDGGQTWSTQYNQSTAQMYHVTADTRVPYRIYGAQQDNSTLAVPSRSLRGAIPQAECYPVGGHESGMVAVRPDDPDIVYAGSLGGRLTRYDHRTGQLRDITPWPEDPIGGAAADARYRFQWTYPVVISPHDPKELYACGNVVFRTQTDGDGWEVISPDLTRADPSRQRSSGGPITQDNVCTEYYCTIFAFVESPSQRGLLWSGSDDGLIHVSRDGSASWRNVTPPAELLPEWALISMISASPHTPGTAFVAATRYKLDDTKPYILRTDDCGEHWRLITSGLEDFTRCVVEDPERKELLFAGTETGLYASWDGGDRWERLQDGLPVAAVHDICVHDGDLIVATHGRGFWILDDITPLRHRERVGLLPVRSTVRYPATRWLITGGRPGQISYLMNLNAAGELVARGEPGNFVDAGANPPDGVMLHYRLAEAAQAVTVKIYEGDRCLFEAVEGVKAPGTHQYIWNMRHTDARKLAKYPVANFWGGDGSGPLAAPGRYVAELTVDGVAQRQPFTIVRHPNLTATDSDLRAQQDLLLAISDKVSEVHAVVDRIESILEQVDAWAARASGHEAVARAGEALASALRGSRELLVQTRIEGGSDIFAHPPRLNSKLAAMAIYVASADAAPTPQTRTVFADLCGRVDACLAQVADVTGAGLRAFEAAVAEAGLPAVAADGR